MKFNALFQVVIVAVVLATIGCTKAPEKGVIVKGKITKGGTPLTLPGMETGSASIKVSMNPVTPDPKSTSQGGDAMLATDGTFRIDGAGKGIHPGKYRISLLGELAPGEDAFNGAYSGDKFLTEVDVPADKVGGEWDMGTIELNDIKPMP